MHKKKLLQKESQNSRSWKCYLGCPLIQVFSNRHLAGEEVWTLKSACFFQPCQVGQEDLQSTCFYLFTLYHAFLHCLSPLNAHGGRQCPWWMRHLLIQTFSSAQVGVAGMLCYRASGFFSYILMVPLQRKRDTGNTAGVNTILQLQIRMLTFKWKPASTSQSTNSVHLSVFSNDHLCFYLFLLLI